MSVLYYYLDRHTIDIPFYSSFIYKLNLYEVPQFYIDPFVFDIL